MNKKGAKESSSSIGSPKFLLCKLNSFFPYYYDFCKLFKIK